MKNFLSLSDFLCVQVILLQFKVYLLSQKVILKHQICKHFRLMIAKINSIFGHLLLDNSCVEFL